MKNISSGYSINNNKASKSVEPNIFGLFYKKYENREAYISSCVDKYSKEFNDNQRYFIKHFIIIILELFYAEYRNDICIPEKCMASFIEMLCRYSSNTISLIGDRINKGVLYEDLICFLEDDLDICGLMADFLTEESLILEKKSISSLQSYDEESQRIIICVVMGEYAESMDLAIVRLLKKSIRNIADKIDKNISAGIPALNND